MPDEPLLTRRRLNRATLGRQLLLERASVEPTDAIERLGGLQAQEPASPYVALWTRLRDFSADALHRAFLERRVVKATLMRVTLHAVSARDFWPFSAALAESHRRFRERTATWSWTGDPELLDELAERAQDYASEPRTNTEMRKHLETLAGPRGDRDHWWAIRTHVPFVVTPNAAPWSFGRPPSLAAARTWLERSPVSAEQGLEYLIRRYLRAFGPATLGDLFQFTRIDRPRLRGTLERLAPELCAFRDERGRLLYDLPGAPLPPEETPAPSRFLPMWDSMLLAYEDRSRVIPDAYRRRLVQVNGDFLPAILVDGEVAGVWWAEAPGGSTRIRWDAFHALPPEAESELAEEAEQLARFVEPREPAVYRRYANTWLRDRLSQA